MVPAGNALGVLSRKFHAIKILIYNNLNEETRNKLD